jgi:hypothetical protein
MRQQLCSQETGWENLMWHRTTLPGKPGVPPHLMPSLALGGYAYRVHTTVRPRSDTPT